MIILNKVSLLEIIKILVESKARLDGNIFNFDSYGEADISCDDISCTKYKVSILLYFYIITKLFKLNNNKVSVIYSTFGVLYFEFDNGTLRFSFRDISQKNDELLQKYFPINQYNEVFYEN